MKLQLISSGVCLHYSIFFQVALLDNDELTGIDNDADDWQFVSLGEQQNFGIKTAGMDL